MKDNYQKNDTNERTNEPPFSNEEKAFLELIARIIVRISFEESYQESKDINDDEELE